MEDFIRENYTEMTDRGLAKELGVSENEVAEKRRELGLNRLGNTEERLEEMQVSKSLSETDRNRVQGFLGEQMARHALPEIRSELEKQLGESWKVVEKAELMPRNAAASARLGDTYGTNKLEFSGDTVVFSDMELEEAVQEAEERVFVADEELVTELKSAEFPSVDLVLHALELCGTSERELEFRDRFSSAFESERRNVEVPVAKDGKVVHVEVKTSRKREAGRMLTSLQRKARNQAEESPYSEFYTLQIDLELEDLEVPDSFEVTVSRLD